MLVRLWLVSRNALRGHRRNVPWAEAVQNAALDAVKMSCGGDFRLNCCMALDATAMLTEDASHGDCVSAVCLMGHLACSGKLCFAHLLSCNATGC